MRKLLLLVPLALWGCKKEEPPPFYKAGEPVEIVKDTLPPDIRIPSELWDQIEGKSKDEHKEEQHAPAAGGGHGPPAAAAPEIPKEGVVIFIGSQVFIKQKGSEVLDRDQYLFDLRSGGGQIDLAEIFGKRNGTFYLGFENPDLEGAENIRYFFLSRTKRRKIGDEVVGAGCNKFFEITDNFKKALKKEGLVLNTTRLRATSILGGTFIISGEKNGRRLLSQVSFTDSKNPDLFCEDQSAKAVH